MVFEILLIVVVFEILLIFVKWWTRKREFICRIDYNFLLVFWFFRLGFFFYYSIIDIVDLIVFAVEVEGVLCMVGCWVVFRFLFYSGFIGGDN